MEVRERLSDSRNYRRGRALPVSYLVVHYTGNRGDTAKDNADYFAAGARDASAHYFVDEDEVWRSVPEGDTAWHCGGAAYLHDGCRNGNSIGIEVCMWDKAGGLRPGSIQRAAELCRELMDRYGIDAGHVLRHYDVTGKRCPAPMVDDPALWAQFKEAIDMTRDEVQALVDRALEAREAVRYDTMDQVPAWGRETVRKLMAKGALRGDGGGLGLSYDLLRVLVINDRTGLYD